MSLIAQAKADIEQITYNQNEFGVLITFTAPDDSTATVAGLHTKHHLGLDTDGNPVNSKNAHISFSEKNLTDEGYVVRDANSEVSLIGHRVSVNDSTGSPKEYIIRETLPDETIGLIVCILGDLE